MLTRATVPPLLWVALVTAACGESHPQYKSSPGDREVTIAATTTLRTAASGVAGIVRTSSGRVIVGDRGTGELEVMDSTGAQLRRLGGKGDGPGEFRLLYRLHLCPGDTLVAYDFSQLRLQYFTEERYIKQVQLPVRLGGSDFLGCVASDSLVFAKLPDLVPGLGLQLEPLTLFTLSPLTGDIRWVATLRGTEFFVSERYKAFYERPHGVQTLAGAGSAGVVFAETGRLELHQVRADGRPHSIFFRPTSSSRVAPQDRTRYELERLADEPDSAARVRLRGVLQEVEWGNRLPATDRLLVALNEQVWLRLAPTKGDTVARWLGVRRGTASVDVLQVPRSLRLLFADAHGFVGAMEDGSGLESILMLRTAAGDVNALR